MVSVYREIVLIFSVTLSLTFFDVESSRDHDADELSKLLAESLAVSQVILREAA